MQQHQGRRVRIQISLRASLTDWPVTLSRFNCLHMRNTCETLSNKLARYFRSSLLFRSLAVCGLDLRAWQTKLLNGQHV